MSSSANRPTAADGRQMHLRTKEGDVAPHCLVVGSPERADVLADRFFTEVQSFSGPREIHAHTGMCNGVRMSVVTHGMGGPYATIVLAEAVASGARRFIRIGSCGGLQRHLPPGHLIIAEGAIRWDGASDDIAPIGYPAIANRHMVTALEIAAVGMSFPYTVGIGATTSSFREGQARPDEHGFVPPHIMERHKWAQQCGVLFYDMETASIFPWCSVRGIWAGAVLAVYANRVTNAFDDGRGEDHAIEVGVRAMLQMATQSPL